MGPAALRTVTATAALFACATPLAALTPEEAWQGWQDMAAAYGQEVMAERVLRDGDQLRVSGATFTTVSEEEDLTITYTVPEIVFAVAGTGAVRITLTDSYDIALTGVDDDGVEVEGVFTLSHPDLEILAQDAPEGALYVYEASAVSLVSGTFTEDGEPFAFELSFVTGPIAGTYGLRGDTDVAAAFEGGDMALGLQARDPDTGTDIVASFELESVSVTSQSLGGTLFGPEDLPSLLAQGFSTRIETQSGAMAFDFAFDEPGESGRVTGRSAGGSSTVAIDPEAMVYDARNTGFEVTISGSEIPIGSVDLALGAVSQTLEMPLAPTDTQQPFALRTALEGLSLGDGVWNLFDPAGILPRDPADLVIALSGAGRWLVDITDPDMAEVEEPAEITRLDIGQILLTLAGAELRAEGGFTFDYSDRSRFDGMPRPEGGLTVVLTGANRLLDRLVQMGLIQPEEAMTARMMSGMLLRPGSGPDTLISEIAVTPSGQITANGAPLPF